MSGKCYSSLEKLVSITVIKFRASNLSVYTGIFPESIINQDSGALNAPFLKP